MKVQAYTGSGCDKLHVDGQTFILVYGKGLDSVIDITEMSYSFKDCYSYNNEGVIGIRQSIFTRTIINISNTDLQFWMK